MTPAEIRAARLLGSLAKDGVFSDRMNERLFVQRMVERAERDPGADMTANEARYLRSIGEKHGIKFEEEEARSEATGTEKDECQAKAGDAADGKVLSAAADPASRPAGGRSPAATSEIMDATAGRDPRPAPEDSSPGAGLSFHPLANLFPLIEGAEFDELVEDIRANGLREEIAMLDGMILDGRNRYRASVAAGLFPADVDWQAIPFDGHFYDFNGGLDPLAFVLSKNLHRRHLSESQRAMVAAKIATLGRGRPSDNPSIEGISTADAAATLHVGHASVERAKMVARHGVPELVHAVESGHASVSGAAMIARLDPAAQRRFMDEVARHPDTGPAFRKVVKDLRREGQDEKKERRAEREEQLGRRQRALPDKKYGVIFADPEWTFDAWSIETGMDRAPDNHYPTSATEAICARPVETIAADDCVLFLCATAPRLPDALLVLERWGFVYKTHRIWRKLRPGKARGPGYWFTGEHELILVGTRGRIVAPAPGTQFPSIFDAPVGEHSEKPVELYEMIEAYFPTLPKIELNARKARPGWDAWGYEAPESREEQALREGASPVTGELEAAE